MDKCSQFKDKFSAYIDSELSQIELREVEEHISSCELCQCEIQMLKTAKQGLRSMLPKVASDEVKNRILNSVFEQSKEKGMGVIWNIKSFNRKHSLAYKGMALAASILLLIFISISDTTSSPMRLYVLEHQKCMTEGHRDYLCKTEHELSHKIENTMGIKAFIPAYFPEGFKFIKGDVCNIKGVTVAHMVMSDGKRILSYFQGKDVKSSLTPPFDLPSPILQKEGKKGRSKGGHGGINAGRLENYKYAYWKKNGVYCIIVGDIAENEIEKIASSQYN